MKKRLAVLLVVCLSMGMMACSQQQETSEPHSQTEQLPSENQSQSASASSSKAEESKPSEVFVSSPESDATEASSSSSAPEPVASVINITVQPVSMTSEHQAFSITDKSEQGLILSYFDNMQPCNPDPHSGGLLFEVSVTRNGSIEFYSILSATDDVGKSYVVRDDQWYTADHALWLSVAAFYPKFDYENNQPIYLIEIYLKTTTEQKGRAIAYYEEPSLVWSETEQEAAFQILAYLDGMKASSESANETNHLVEIYLQGKSVDRKYICYDAKDANGNCIVKYEGERPAMTPGGSPGEYSGGGWFVADAGLYKYLDSLL